MTGLFYLMGIGLWLIVTNRLCKMIPSWLGVTRHSGLIRALFFPVVLAAPVADELIGRWQFSRLCEREAVVTLSADWESIKRARRREIPITTLSGYLIRIQSQRIEYFDPTTEKNFLTIQAFHAYGGFLLYRMALGLGNSTACWPIDHSSIYRKVNLDELLRR